MTTRVEPAQTKVSLPGALQTVAVSEEKMSEQDVLINIYLANCASFAETAVCKQAEGHVCCY